MKPYSVGDAFNYGWTKFQANVGPILLGLLGLMVVSAIVFFIWNLITGAILSGFSGSDAGLVFLLVSSAFSALLGGVIQVFVQAAITRGALAITYGRQIEISRAAQSVQKVSEADAIIVNPTHYTVALRYRREEAPAPIVIAKGLDEIALKMQVEARRNDIPRVENRQLARALYAQVDEGQMIPEDLYAAVAEILALIYKRKKNRNL